VQNNNIGSTGKDANLTHYLDVPVCQQIQFLLSTDK
jgi:hypothetical protein